MVQEMLMVARHSPRVRAMETADHFITGFQKGLERQRVPLKFMNLGRSKVRLTTRSQLEAITTASETAEKGKLSAEELEATLAAINEGKPSEGLLSKAEMLSSSRMGYILAHDRRFGALAKRLGARAKDGEVQGNLEPTLVSIFLRHSKNDGDKLTDEGKALAEKQGHALATHLMQYVFPGSGGKVRPTVILHVSHGGGKTPGQLDWTFEQALGKDVKAMRGQVMHAEGVVKLGYGDGTVHNLYLRQDGVMHFHSK